MLRSTFDIDEECTKILVQSVNSNDMKSPGRSNFFKIIDPQTSHRELEDNNDPEKL